VPPSAGLLFCDAGSFVSSLFSPCCPPSFIAAGSGGGDAGGGCGTACTSKGVYAGRDHRTYIRFGRGISATHDNIKHTH
jgi:hypothetical protein